MFIRPLIKSAAHRLFTLVITLFFLYPIPPSLAEENELALFPMAFYMDSSMDYLKQGIPSILASRLRGKGIQIMSDDSITPLLNEEDQKGIMSNQRAEELARTLNARYALFGSITSIGSQYSLDLAFLDRSKDTGRFTRISEIVSEDSLIPKLGDLADRFLGIIQGQGFTAPKMAETPTPKMMQATPSPLTTQSLFQERINGQYVIRPTGFKPISMDLMACDTGDLDGDGHIEIVILSRDKVQVYVKQGESLELRGTLRSGLGTNFLTLSVGDADKNGKAEICVVSQTGESRPQSTIYEWTGSFKSLHKQTGHVQIARTHDPGTCIMLFQDSTSIDFFSGGIWIMEKSQAGEWTKKKELKGLERKAQFYTLTFFDINKDGKDEILGLGPINLSETAQLYVWDSDGEYLWRSSDRFGGTNNYLRLKKIDAEDEYSRIPFNSKPLIADMDEDGKEEVLVITNLPSVQFLQDLKIFVKGTLTAFEIDRMELIPSWTTKEIDYCITDMQMSGNTLFLVVHKGQMSNTGKREGRIMWME